MTDMEKDFWIERYRYVLDQKKFLNKTTFVVASIYQAGLVLIVAANYQLWTALADFKLPAKFVLAASNGLILLMWVLTFFSVSMLISGVVSWFGYRRDEAEIEERYFGKSRRLPLVSDFFRWYETYIVIGIVVISIGFTFFFSALHSYL